MKLPTNYSITEHMYIHSNVGKQMADIKFYCYMVLLEII